MGSETRHSTKRRKNPANLVTSRKVNTRLARPIIELQIQVERLHGTKFLDQDRGLAIRIILLRVNGVPDAICHNNQNIAVNSIFTKG